MHRLAVAAFLSIGSLACFAPLVQNPGDILVGVHRRGANDLTAYFLGAMSFPARERSLGNIGHWNPYRFGGVPHTGNPQAALWYPPNWVAYLNDHPARLGWTMVAHHLFAGWGAYLLCRTQRWRRLASAVGGLAFLAAPNLVAHTAEGHYTLICAAAWVPWAAWAFVRWRQRRRAGLAVLAGIFALCFLAGHAQTTYYLVLVLSAVATTIAVRQAWAGNWPAAKQVVAQWTLLGLMTAMLCAVDLLPIWMYARGTLRTSGLSAADAGSIHVGLSNLWQLVFPQALGTADTYRGPGQFYWETLCYFGILPMVLALLGLVAKRRSTFVWSLATVGLFAGWFAAGLGTGLFDTLHYVLPGVSMFRAPARALLFSSLAVAVLAAAGTHYLQVFARKLSTPSVRLAWTTALGLIAAVCLVELSYFNRSLVASIPSESLRNNSQLVADLQPKSSEGRVYVRQELLSDREAESAGIHKVSSYDPVFPAATTALALGLSDQSPDLMIPRFVFGFGGIKTRALSPELLDRFHVRYLAIPATSQSPESPWVRVSQGTVPGSFVKRGEAPRQIHYVLYENRSSLPRAFVQGNVVEVAEPKSAIEMVSETDPRESLVLARDVLPDGPRQTFQPATIVEYTPDRVVLEAELENPGYLYLGDAWRTGWKAEEAGEPLPLLPANVAFRAVPLTAGKHRVTMQFEPPGRTAGLWLTVLGLACLMVYAWSEVTRPNKSPATAEPSGTSIDDPSPAESIAEDALQPVG